MRMRLKYLRTWVDRKTGLAYARFERKSKGISIKLPRPDGSRDFYSAYFAALNGGTPSPTEPGMIGASRNTPGSVRAALAQYLVSDKIGGFLCLSEGTRRQRRNVIERFREAHGDKPLPMMHSDFIRKAMSELTPHMATNFLKTLRHLMAWAVANDLCKTDPCAGIKTPRTPKTNGFAMWTEEQIAQFEARHPIGSKARLAFALLLYTGQRRGDVIRMGRQHIKNGLLTITQKKTTGGRTTGVTVKVPVHPTLAAIIEATPSEHLTFLTTQTGKPYIGEHFSNQMRAWCDEAGVPGVSSHGLRKACCRRLVEARCTPHMIAGITGHLTLREIEHYTAEFNRELAAREGMARLIESRAT